MSSSTHSLTRAQKGQKSQSKATQIYDSKFNLSAAYLFVVCWLFIFSFSRNETNERMWKFHFDSSWPMSITQPLWNKTNVCDVIYFNLINVSFVLLQARVFIFPFPPLNNWIKALFSSSAAATIENTSSGFLIPFYCSGQWCLGAALEIVKIKLSIYSWEEEREIFSISNAYNEWRSFIWQSVEWAREQFTLKLKFGMRRKRLIELAGRYTRVTYIRT